MSALERTQFVTGQHTELLGSMQNLQSDLATRIAVLEGLIAKQPAQHDIGTPSHEQAVKMTPSAPPAATPAFPAPSPDRGDVWHTARVGPWPGHKGRDLTSRFAAAAPGLATAATAQVLEATVQQQPQQQQQQQEQPQQQQ